MLGVPGGKPVLHISDLRENDKCLRKMVQFIQGNTNTNVHIVKKQLLQRISELNQHNSDLASDNIKMLTDKNIYRD